VFCSPGNGAGCCLTADAFASRLGMGWASFGWPWFYPARISFAWRAGQFQARLCRRPTRARQSPRPPDPGLRPASPPLRGPFASSGFLTDRRDAPSLARARLFATSLSLVLKSLTRSAVLTASLPAVISSLTVWSFIAAGVRASRDFRTGLITGNHFLCMYLSFYICLFAGLAKRLSEAARQKHYERLGEASAALRNNRRPGCADRTSAKGRREPGMASPDGPQAAGRDEGTPRSGARRQPDAGIVKGRASAP